MSRPVSQHITLINRAFIVICMTLFTHGQGFAGEVLEAFVNHEDDHYVLHLDMRINGKSTAVYDVLTDFDNLHRVNDTIKFSERRESHGKVHQVYFVSEGCLLFFCRKVKQLVTVTELGKGFIMSNTDPEHSDLEYGRTLWQIIDEGSTTRIKYNSDYVPNFWVPPLFGTYFFKKRMLQEGQKTVNGIERLINEPTS